MPAEFHATVKLNSDGNGTYTDSSGTSDAFTWSTSGSTLSVTDNEGTETMEYQISGNTLTTTDADGTVTWLKV